MLNALIILMIAVILLGSGIMGGAQIRNERHLKIITKDCTERYELHADVQECIKKLKGGA